MRSRLSRDRGQAAGRRRLRIAAGAVALALPIAAVASASGQVSAAAALSCAAGAACAKGAWQVLPVRSPVRASRAVLLYNGDVLLVAGSGDDPAFFTAGTFTSAVYNPNKGTFTVLRTPDDFFRAGAVQLADGRVLILGGNKAYPTAANGEKDEGLNTSYLFNPVTDKYQRVSDLNGGHWAPSATELGNGDVIAYGGLNEAGDSSATTEYFRYNPAISADGRWLPASQISEGNGSWGLYPDMILRRDGELFYTGSHVSGDNITPAGPAGTKRGQGGAGSVDISRVLNPAASTPVTPVKGLQDTPGGPAGTDMTDESMSVLLPPAQAQRVLLMGGGNILTSVPATRLTDLIDLSSADPRYTPGPLIPRGALAGGKLEPASDGKMYVSAVILPDGQVFETGGALEDRADPVAEAAMYNPATGTFSAPMASDPVPRIKFSSAFLLPDGRVMAVGDYSGDGSFDQRISIYSPPYLFRGARPKITGMTTRFWTYGSTQRITVSQKIVKAELIRPASVAQSSDPNQRLVALPASVSGNHVRLTVTGNPDIAPPGWYMLFVVNAAGVPSVASWVHVSRVAANR
jgi:hypothetical protein